MYDAPEVAGEIAKRINTRNAQMSNSSEKNRLEKQLLTIDGKIKNLVRAVADGFDVEVAKNELEGLKKEKEKMESDLLSLKSKEFSRPKIITAEDILRLYEDFESSFLLQNPIKNESC